MYVCAIQFGVPKIIDVLLCQGVLQYFTRTLLLMQCIQISDLHAPCEGITTNKVTPCLRSRWYYLSDVIAMQD